MKEVEMEAVSMDVNLIEQIDDLMGKCSSHGYVFIGFLVNAETNDVVSLNSAGMESEETLKTVGDIAELLKAPRETVN